MALQGPFPATLVIDNAGDGDALMLALNALGGIWLEGGTVHPPVDEQDRQRRAAMVERFQRLYTAILFACGDD